MKNVSSQPELVSPFLRKLEEKIKELNLDYNQVHNADETGLYWKLLPGKTTYPMMKKLPLEEKRPKKHF